MSFPVMQEKLKGRYDMKDKSGITHMGRCWWWWVGPIHNLALYKYVWPTCSVSKPHVMVCLVDPLSFLPNNSKKKTDPTNLQFERERKNNCRNNETIYPLKPKGTQERTQVPCFDDDRRETCAAISTLQCFSMPCNGAAIRAKNKK